MIVRYLRLGCRLFGKYVFSNLREVCDWFIARCEIREETELLGKPGVEVPGRRVGSEIKGLSV